MNFHPSRSIGLCARPRSTAIPVSKNRYGGLDPQVVQNIRVTARRLARANAVPGMDVEDYEQDLVMDLWRRQDAYDPGRGT